MPAQEQRVELHLHLNLADPRHPGIRHNAQTAEAGGEGVGIADQALTVCNACHSEEGDFFILPLDSHGGGFRVVGQVVDR